MVVLALVLALATVATSTLFLLRPAVSTERWALERDVPTVQTDGHGSDPDGLHLILVPHPDDEISAWTSLQEADDLHPVIVLLTQGEATQRCSVEALGNHLQTELGELPPRPDPTAGGASSTACREARLNAFRDALHEAATHTPVVDVDWSDATTEQLGGTEGQVVRGDAATFVLLDLGDDTLTAPGVEQTVRDLLDDPDLPLPDLPLTRITSSAYYATTAEESVEAPCEVVSTCPGGERAYIYDRPDHRAVQDAARALAPLAQEGSWLVTNPYDPAATTHLALRDEVYEAFMGLGPGEPATATRIGSHQRHYGWLAFPDVWRPGDLPLDSRRVMFPRVQSYEVVAP